LPFSCNCFTRHQSINLAHFIWNNEILDRVGIFKAVAIRKMFTFKPAWHSPFVLSLSSHIYRSSIFYSRYSYVTFFFLDMQIIFIYTMTDFFRLFVHNFLYSFLSNCEFMRNTFMIYFVYVIDIRCGDNFIFLSNFSKQCTSIFTAMHQDAFNVLCIPNCVDLSVSD